MKIRKAQGPECCLDDLQPGQEEEMRESMKGHMFTATGEEVCEPWVEIALDTIRREIGEQGGVPDRIESSWYVYGDGSDLIIDI